MRAITNYQDINGTACADFNDHRKNYRELASQLNIDISIYSPIGIDLHICEGSTYVYLLCKELSTENIVKINVTEKIEAVRNPEICPSIIDFLFKRFNVVLIDTEYEHLDNDDISEVII